MSLLTKAQVKACRKFNPGQVARTKVPKRNIPVGALVHIDYVADGRSSCESTVPIHVSMLNRKRGRTGQWQYKEFYNPQDLEIVDECYGEWVKGRKDLTADLAALVRRYAINLTGGDEEKARDHLIAHLGG